VLTRHTAGATAAAQQALPVTAFGVFEALVRHEHDAAYRQRGVVPRLGKLVVGTAADDAAAQAGDGRVIQHRAERRRGEHVDVRMPAA
jgi:hypothetical protein